MNHVTAVAISFSTSQTPQIHIRTTFESAGLLNFYKRVNINRSDNLITLTYTNRENLPTKGAGGWQTLAVYNKDADPTIRISSKAQKLIGIQTPINLTMNQSTNKIISQYRNTDGDLVVEVKVDADLGDAKTQNTATGFAVDSKVKVLPVNDNMSNEDIIATIRGLMSMGADVAIMVA